MLRAVYCSLFFVCRSLSIGCCQLLVVCRLLYVVVFFVTFFFVFAVVCWCLCDVCRYVWLC